jgi:hypothetical protein
MASIQAAYASLSFHQKDCHVSVFSNFDQYKLEPFNFFPTTNRTNGATHCPRYFNFQHSSLNIIPFLNVVTRTQQLDIISHQ